MGSRRACPGARFAHLVSGRALVKRANSCRTESPVIGSRQSRAIAFAGPKTKSRSRKRGCGICKLLLAQMPPLQRIISMSSTRARQDWPPALRPKARSTPLVACSSSSGLCRVSTNMQQLQNLRSDGPIGRLSTIGATKSCRMPSFSRASIAAGITLRGWPIRGCR